MTLDEEAGVFRIDMRRYPSMARLLEDPQLEPSSSYHEHCSTLYRRVLEPLGFRYRIDLSKARTDAACSLEIRWERDRKCRRGLETG